MGAQKLPYRVSYITGGNARPKNLYYTSESTARHEAVRLSQRGYTAAFAEANRNGTYITKQVYTPSPAGGS